VVTPKNVADLAAVTVITSSGQHSTTTDSGDDTIEFGPRPQITSLSARVGTSRGGKTISLSGHHFYAVTAVYFGSKRGTHVHVLSQRKLRATTPSHRAGTVHVRVSACGLSPVTGAGSYTYR